MLNFKNLFPALLLSTIFTGFVAAQPPPPSSAPQKRVVPSNNTQTKQGFISLDGGFSIDLPQYFNSFSSIKPTAGVNKGGSQFVWNNAQGFYMISFADRIFSPERYKEVLQDSAKGVIRDVTNDNGKLISKNEISLNGNSGFEIRMQLKDGSTGLLRYFLVKDRMYILSSGWKNGEDGNRQLKIIDSFKLIDAKAIIAKKVEDATPAPLPQVSAAKKLNSHAQDEGLKGKVKLVTETQEDLTGTWYSSGIKMTSEDFYNEDGNQTKQILYDYRGNPSDITVYGYIEGMRVLKSGGVPYEYNPPAPAAISSPIKVESKPFDVRYSTKIEHAYDGNTRLKETIRYRNNGEMTGKTVYIYGDKTVEKSFYNQGGEITFKTFETFDDKGNLIEKTSDHQNSKYAPSKYSYTYDSFDEKGNWTKRIVYGKEGQYGGKSKDQHYIEYRTITYYT